MCTEQTCKQKMLFEFTACNINAVPNVEEHGFGKKILISTWFKHCEHGCRNPFIYKIGIWHMHLLFQWNKQVKHYCVKCP